MNYKKYWHEIQKNNIEEKGDLISSDEVECDIAR